jgi:hypothetical protein
MKSYSIKSKEAAIVSILIFATSAAFASGCNTSSPESIVRTAQTIAQISGKDPVTEAKAALKKALSERRADLASKTRMAAVLAKKKNIMKENGVSLEQINLATAKELQAECNAEVSEIQGILKDL